VEPQRHCAQNKTGALPRRSEHPVFNLGISVFAIALQVANSGHGQHGKYVGQVLVVENDHGATPQSTPVNSASDFDVSMMLATDKIGRSNENARRCAAEDFGL
jgi:hypothetical protein